MLRNYPRKTTNKEKLYFIGHSDKKITFCSDDEAPHYYSSCCLTSIAPDICGRNFGDQWTSQTTTTETAQPPPLEQTTTSRPNISSRHPESDEDLLVSGFNEEELASDFARQLLRCKKLAITVKYAGKVRCPEKASMLQLSTGG
ncbi:hypothetical protein KIN20_011143 [Parelaphostrongylus tenuis]|uniref:Uncharacterized protein n=1 Tax=Parelaphostrongylus tenuis TaxID=148309 RepID=A0AAD5QKW2_PARTN|nr:hypothetical protein KIN20_011143 [Parelaphostrongylus tenuis]